MSRRRRPVLGVLRLCLRLLLLAVVWLLGVAAWIVHVGNRDEAGPADAIVVLGAAAYDAVPSPVFEARIEHGLHLFGEGLAARLIFTGGYGGGGARFAESQVARRYALRQGVPDKAILIESLSRNTHDNLRQARRLMQDHGLHTAIVVSDPLHMARALRLARREGIRAHGSATPTTRFRSWQTSWRFLVREVYFFHRDHWTRLTGSHALP